MPSPDSSRTVSKTCAKGPYKKYYRAFSNYRNRENIRQAPQVDYQCQAILVPQHSAAVRHFGRSLIEQRILSRGISSDHFICRDANA
jgi:hypothetical protein